jgi:hypothetical protein
MPNYCELGSYGPEFKFCSGHGCFSSPAIIILIIIKQWKEPGYSALGAVKEFFYKESWKVESRAENAG